MIFSQFQRHDLLMLWPSLVCIAASLVFFVYRKYTPAVILLFLGGLGLRLMMAHLDPFFWDWDERFHGMVAKNLVLHPLMPTLYDKPELPYDYTNWTANHIWVHKQPLALWQMALSYSIFGASAFTARIPMAIEGALMILLLYRSGRLLMGEKAGFLSAFIYTISFYALDFCTGGQATDHIDFALVFYVSASLWAWLEYVYSRRNIWIVLIGLFAGLAVLSKWTIGLLVFAAWGIAMLLIKEERKTLKNWIGIAAAFAISIIIFMPWQLYCLKHYPKETKYELEYNQSHLFKEVDGRGETPWYYMDAMGHNFGGAAPFVIGFGIVLLWRRVKNRYSRAFVLGALIIPYFLFSLVAATKMPAFCYIAVLPVMLCLGAFAADNEEFIHKKASRIYKPLVVVCLGVLGFLSINFRQVAELHTGYDPTNYYRVNKVRFNEYFRSVKGTLPEGTVIFGAMKGWEVEMMFYSGYTCYPNIPDAEKYEQLKARHLKMAIVADEHAPAYMMNDPEVKKVPPLKL